MLSCKEMDNLAAVEIEISARVSTEEFDRTAKKLEGFIGRHGRVRVLEIVNHFWSTMVEPFRSPISSRKRWKPRGTGCFGLRAPPISSENTNLQSIVDLRSFP
jgi:hypothetical protein